MNFKDQKDIIIFSYVRNNNSSHIGFLNDNSRLNVNVAILIFNSF